MTTRVSTRNRTLCQCGTPVNINTNRRYDDWDLTKCQLCQVAPLLCDCGKRFKSKKRLQAHRQSGAHARHLLVMSCYNNHEGEEELEDESSSDSSSEGDWLDMRMIQARQQDGEEEDGGLSMATTACPGYEASLASLSSDSDFDTLEDHEEQNPSTEQPPQKVTSHCCSSLLFSSYSRNNRTNHELIVYVYVLHLHTAYKI